MQVQSDERLKNGQAQRICIRRRRCKGVLPFGLAVLFFMVVYIGVCSLSLHRPPPIKAYRYVEYTVRSGDTLWSVARRFYPGEHTGKAVEEIRKASGRTGPEGPVLWEGDVIYLPAVQTRPAIGK